MQFAAKAPLKGIGVLFVFAFVIGLSLNVSKNVKLMRTLEDAISQLEETELANEPDLSGYHDDHLPGNLEDEQMLLWGRSNEFARPSHAKQVPRKLNTRRKRSAQHVRMNHSSTVRSSAPRGLGGTTYVRWGRTKCPEGNGTSVVYSGVGGGSWHLHAGGASKMLCLPNKPVWGTYDDASSGYAFMYGAEYEDDGLFERTNAEALLQHNVPCVVCRTDGRPSSIMIPARTRCYGDWKHEYHGYLMGGLHKDKHQRTQYVCVDEAPEADRKGFRDENGRLLYRVEAVCGSLPCPKYMNNRDLSCVVCSK